MIIKDPKRVLQRSAGDTYAHLKFNDKASDATYDYYGFTGSDGHYVIMRIKPDLSECRYAIGSAEYSTAWTAREIIPYLMYHELGL